VEEWGVGLGLFFVQGDTAVRGESAVTGGGGVVGVPLQKEDRSVLEGREFIGSILIGDIYVIGRKLENVLLA